jgi:hypothetical protein
VFDKQAALESTFCHTRRGEKPGRRQKPNPQDARFAAVPACSVVPPNGGEVENNGLFTGSRFFRIPSQDSIILQKRWQNARPML